MTAKGKNVLAAADERVREVEELVLAELSAADCREVAGWLVSCAEVLASERQSARGRPTS